MKNKKIKIEFYTDDDTAAFIQTFAKGTNQTEGEFVNEICQNFKNNIMNYVKEQENIRTGAGDVK